MNGRAATIGLAACTFAMHASCVATHAASNAGSGAASNEARVGASLDEPASSFVRSESSEGYTSFQTRVRRYRRSDGTGSEVALVGVVHIGDRAYYERLVDMLAQEDVVLYESVLPRGAFGTRGESDAVKQIRTQEAMLFLRTLLERMQRAEGSYPASMAELRAFTVSRDTRLARPIDLACIDGWGGAIAYALSAPTTFSLRSLGSDARAGGRDDAMDLVLGALPARDEANTQSKPKAAGAARDERRDLYGELASALDVALQVRSIDYDRAGWIPADLPLEELLDRLWRRGERSMTIEMLSSDNGLAQGVLRFLLSFVSKSVSFKKLVVETMGKAASASGANASGGLSSVDTRLIIDERNDAVLLELRHQLDRADVPRTIAIFYGAAHMPEFEISLRREFDMVPVSSQWFTAMGADEWDAKRIRTRVSRLESSRAGILAHDPRGSCPAVERFDQRLRVLHDRLAHAERTDGAATPASTAKP